MSPAFRVLATAFDYRPRLGGVATLNYELLRAMNRIPGVEVTLLAPAAPGSEECDRASGVLTIRVALPSTAGRAILPLAMHEARRALALKPNAILNSIWMPDGVASLACAPVLLPARIPYFVSVYGVELLESRRGLKKRLRAALAPGKKAVLSGARAVFSISRFTAGLAEQCGCRNVVTLHPGVDSKTFRPGPKAEDLIRQYGLQGREVLMTLSRLDDYKGIDRAIASLRLVAEKYPKIAYLICGEGPDHARLESLVRHHRMQEHVIFAGAIPFERTADYYNLCDVFVLLSRDDRETPNVEGFGLVLLEAAACGKAAIAGRSGGIPDAVADGESGWLVDPTDDRAIAAAMLAALGDPARTARVGERARARAEGFRWSTMAEKMIEEMRGRAHVRD